MKDWNNNREDQQFNMWSEIKRTWDSPRVHFLAGCYVSGVAGGTISTSRPIFLSSFPLNLQFLPIFFSYSFFLFIIPHFSSLPSLHACRAVGLSRGFPWNTPYDVIFLPTFNQRFLSLCVCGVSTLVILIFSPFHKRPIYFFLPFCLKGSPLEKKPSLFFLTNNFEKRSNKFRS